MDRRILDVLSDLNKEDVKLWFGPAQDTREESVADGFKSAGDVFESPGTCSLGVSLVLYLWTRCDVGSLDLPSSLYLGSLGHRFCGHL